MFPQQGRRFLGGVSQPDVTGCLGFGIAAIPSASRSASAFWLVRAGAEAERRERDRRAEAARQQEEEQRRQAEEDRKLLESMPPQVGRGWKRPGARHRSERSASSR